MRRLIWAPTARDNLKAVLTYHEGFNPSAAKRLVERIEATADLLARRPIGRPGRIPGIYEKSVRQTPYIIAYEMTDRDGVTMLTILRVIHAARNWRPGLWPDED